MILLLGPWLLFVFLLCGPFVLVLTIVVALVAAVGLLALSAAVIASPYLLIRYLRSRRNASARPHVHLQLFRKLRVGSGRLGSPQTKGLS